MKGALILFILALAAGFGQAALAVAERGDDRPTLVLADVGTAAVAYWLTPQVKRVTERAVVGS